MDTYFSDYFKVKEASLEKFGAFNISLFVDLPLFIDPFLLFNSKKKEYKKLHDEIINYIAYLREKSAEGNLEEGTIDYLYRFKEVKQNWFGYSEDGNSGNGLGRVFARKLHNNLDKLFKDFGNENITKSSHLEKLCLIDKGVGKDHISDFTTNLIKGYLLNYTQKFTLKHVSTSKRKKFHIAKVSFNYDTETWESGKFILPYYVEKNDFIILTPKDLLTREKPWINRIDLIEDIDQILDSIPNEELRAQINRYFLAQIQKRIRRVKSDKKSEKIAKKIKAEASIQTVYQYPQLIDYYIRNKEDNGDKAIDISKQKVDFVNNIFVNNIKKFLSDLDSSNFYSLGLKTFEETQKRIEYFKDIIENKDGYKIFYSKGRPIKSEKDLQLLFKFVWFRTDADVNAEVNNGRGPVDFKISKGSKDRTLVEFKLASSKSLKRNLENQVGVYEKANNGSKSFKVIIYFDDMEYENLIKTLNDLKLSHEDSIILLDARKKVSASKL